MKQITFRGKTLNQRTINMILAAEKILGYELTIIQGSYNAGGVSASAGTHDGGGAIDCWGKDPDKIVRVLRIVGFAAWHRTASQGPWNDHIHAIAIGDPDLSSGAAKQVQEYYDGFDGLAGSGRDDGPRFSPIPTWESFQYKQRPPIDLSNSIDAFRIGGGNKPLLSVKRIQRRLNRKLGAKLAVDGIAGKQTRAAYRKWQEKLGYTESDANGIPGRTSLTKLAGTVYRVID